MSQHRVSPQAGWVNPKKLPKGPTGRALCRQCGKEVPKGRRSFCGDTCVHDWKMKTDPAYVRDQVWRRDHGVCAVCGLDTREIKERSARLEQLARRHWGYDPYEKYFGPLVAIKIDWLVWIRLTTGHRDWPRSKNPPFYLDGALWQADHIVPVAEGGGETGLENYQTLCSVCHLRKTREQHQRKAAARRAALGEITPPKPKRLKVQPQNQLSLWEELT